MSKEEVREIKVKLHNHRKEKLLDALGIMCLTIVNETVLILLVITILNLICVLISLYTKEAGIIIAGLFISFLLLVEREVK